MTEIQFINADWNAPEQVKTLVTTRTGGVSKAPFDSLNLGLHVNDVDEHVQTNRQKLIDIGELPSEPVWLNQVHGIDIIELKGKKSVTPPVCDGVYTQQKSTVCAVMTADCLPLFLTNTKGDRVALLHAGWRGLANGIIEKGVALLCDSGDTKETPNNLVAWAGPCISINNFEIGNEVKEQLHGPDYAYKPSLQTNKHYADLYQLTGERLSRVGVNNYTHSQYCSFTDEHLFFSHRRDKKTGRMASLIWIE